MPKKKTVKQEVEKETRKIMTVNNISYNITETVEPVTQELDGKTWIKTTSKRRQYDVK